jgi:hypothetical protein
MIQCKDCELYRQEPDGRRVFLCDPFNNVKEAECLAKWQLLRLDMIAATQNSLAAAQAQMAPIQDKIMKYIKRELEDIDESDKWKIDEEPDTEPTPFDENNYPDFGDNPKENQ